MKISVEARNPPLLPLAAPLAPAQLDRVRVVKMRQKKRIYFEVMQVSLCKVLR